MFLFQYMFKTRDFGHYVFIDSFGKRHYLDMSICYSLYVFVITSNHYQKIKQMFSINFCLDDKP